MSISFKFAWFDLWIGVFVDKRHNPLVTKYYICPLPCCLITVVRKK